MSDRRRIFQVRNPEILQNAIAAVSQMPDDGSMRVVIEPNKDRRSLAQNALMWKWHTELGNHIGESKERNHLEFKWRFVAPLMIRDDSVTGLQEVYDLARTNAKAAEALADLITTTDRPVGQFSEALTDYERFAASRHGFAMPHPEDLYYEAMGRK